jgi:hypothetical protein
MKTALSSMELLLSRMENGRLNLPDEMLMMMTSLAYSAGIIWRKMVVVKTKPFMVDNPN